MTDAFDPYYKWLSIPPEDQPPHHYQLLGVKPFEADGDVLESAADQRMSHVRSFQTGKHAAESQKLLNELAVARLCLLSPEKRQVYDRELKAKLAADKPPAAPARPVAPPSPAPPAQPLSAQPLVVARPLAAKPMAAKHAVPAAEPAVALGFDPLEQPPARRASKKRPSNQSPAIYAGVGLGLIAVVAVAWIAIGGGGSDDRPIAVRDTKAPFAAADAARTGDENPAPAHPATAPSKSKSSAAEVDSEAPPDHADSDPSTEDLAGPGNPADDMADEMPVAESDADNEVDSGEPVADDRPEPPDADQVAAAVAEIQRVLHDDYTAAKKPAEKAALAEKLIALMPDSSGAGEQYALVSEARRLAIAASSPALALQAADTLAQSFAVDRFEQLAKTADELSARDLSPAARKELVEAIEPLVEQALAAGQFAPGRRLAAVGLAAARKTNQNDIAKTLVRQGKELAAGEKLAASAADARAQLEQNPDDPKANETLGKYLCLYAGDWPAGLAHLAKADDPALRSVAELEAAADLAPSAQAKLGDAWWALAEHGGVDAARMRGRAGYWYEQAVGELTGLTKTRVEKRLEETQITVLPQSGDARMPERAAPTVTADKIVLWNTRGGHWADRGTTDCHIELRKAGKVVWSQKDVKVTWSGDAEPATEIALPRVPFDTLHIDVVGWHQWGGGLCEIEVIKGHKNLALGKPAKANGAVGGFTAEMVVDGILNSNSEKSGYWLTPDHHRGWIEVQVAPPPAPTGRTVYLSDLPVLETEVHTGTALADSIAVGGATSTHGLFMHPAGSGHSHAAFALDKKYKTLSGAAAVADSAGERSVTPLTFRILGDGKELWRTTIQSVRDLRPLTVHVGSVNKLELFVDCPGSVIAAHAFWVDLQLTRTGAAPASSTKPRAQKPLPNVDASQSGKASGGVIADKLVVWNCNNHSQNDRGMLTCNVELRKDDKVVWSKQDVPITWSADQEPATTIPLPKIAFETLRLETATYHSLGTGLCEVEIFRGRANLAQGKPAAASGNFGANFPASAVVDGTRNSSQAETGYWIGPDHQNAWIEVQVVPPAEQVTHKPKSAKGSVVAGKWISKDATYTLHPPNDVEPPLPSLLSEDEKAYGTPGDEYAFQVLGQAYIVIDLGRSKTITKIYIRNRAVQGRSAGLRVYLSNKQDERGPELWAAGPDMPEWTIELPRPQKARYITIGLDPNKTNDLWFHLRKVKVYGAE